MADVAENCPYMVQHASIHVSIAEADSSWPLNNIDYYIIDYYYRLGDTHCSFATGFVLLLWFLNKFLGFFNISFVIFNYR